MRCRWRLGRCLGGFGREYQAVCGQWAEFEQRFARALGAGAGAYAEADAVA
ncbi:PE domain-containing protein, partial [Mycobacterium ulcerans]